MKSIAIATEEQKNLDDVVAYDHIIQYKRDKLMESLHETTLPSMMDLRDREALYSVFDAYREDLRLLENMSSMEDPHKDLLDEIFVRYFREYRHDMAAVLARNGSISGKVAGILSYLTLRYIIMEVNV